jgi:Family of unknown function (DUF5681)
MRLIFGDKSEFQPHEEPQSMRSRIPAPEDSDDHTAEAVGYGRPPLHTRFKPGQSGNPKGRRKHRKNVMTLLQEVMDEKIKMKEGDKTKSVSKGEAMIRAAALKALKGDAKSFDRLMALLQKIQTSEPQVCRVIRAPPEVKSIEEWHERYAPKDLTEVRSNMEQGSSDTISGTLPRKTLTK